MGQVVRGTGFIAGALMIAGAIFSIVMPPLGWPTPTLEERLGYFIGPLVSPLIAATVWALIQVSIFRSSSFVKAWLVVFAVVAILAAGLMWFGQAYPPRTFK